MSMMPCCGKGALYCFCDSNKKSEYQYMLRYIEHKLGGWKVGDTVISSWTPSKPEEVKVLGLYYEPDNGAGWCAVFKHPNSELENELLCVHYAWLHAKEDE